MHIFDVGHHAKFRNEEENGRFGSPINLKLLLSALVAIKNILSYGEDEEFII